MAWRKKGLPKNSTKRRDQDSEPDTDTGTAGRAKSPSVGSWDMLILTQLPWHHISVL